MRQRATVATVAVLLGLAAVSPALADGKRGGRAKDSQAASAEETSPRAEKVTTTTAGGDAAPATGDDPAADGTEPGGTAAADGSTTTTTAVADDDSAAGTAPSSSSSSTTTTTAGDAGADDSTSTSTAPTTATTAAPTTTTVPPKNTCEAPQVTREPAPETGARKSYTAGSAGEVEIERFNSGELRVVSATAADGWTADVNSPSGSRVAVRFTSSADPSTLVKFNASLNSDGTEIVIRVLNCKANDAGAGSDDDARSSAGVTTPGAEPAKP